MAIATSETAREYLNIVADVPIDVPFPLFAEGEVQVFYGNINAQAELYGDYTIELMPLEFNTFKLTPTVSLLSKINTLIGDGDPDANRIVVRRVLALTTTATSGFVQNTAFTSREFDRVAMKLMQIDEQNNRALALGPGVVGQLGGVVVEEIVPGKALVWNAEGDGIVTGDAGGGGGSGGDATTLNGHGGEYYRNRANHTGTQPTSTIEGLDNALGGKAPSVHSHSIAQVETLQAALDAKAALASPQFSGTPTAPTALASDNSNTLATTAHVKAAISASGGGGGGSDDATTLNGQDGDYYRNRANHTGSQAISTVTNLQATLDALAASSALPAITAPDAYKTLAVNGAGNGAEWIKGFETRGEAYVGKSVRILSNRFREDLPTVLDFIPTAQHAAILNYSSSYDATAAMREAAVAIGSGKLYLPKGKICLADTLILPGGVHLAGRGRRDSWENINYGTIISGVGTLTGKRWTDITGADAADDTPLIVAGGNNVWLFDMTLLPGANGRSMGFFVPAQKQCGFDGLDAFDFTDGCLYLDATWSDRNTTMKALHPLVVPNAGVNEFKGENFFFLAGGTTGYGIKVQGTTRPGNTTATPELWQWGWGGASDIYISKGRLGGQGANGGGLKHDGQLHDDSILQGMTLRDVAFRNGGGKYFANFDRSNRILIDGSYGENKVGTGAPVINVTSRTQQGVNGIHRINDSLNCAIHLNGVDTGYSGSNVPWEVTRCITTIRGNQYRMFTPNIEASYTGTVKFSSFASNGNFEFAYDNGTTRTSYMLARNDVLRPVVNGALGLGTSSFGWGQIYSSNFVMPGTNNAVIPQIKARYSQGMVQFCAYETPYFRITNVGIRPENDNTMSCGTGGYRFTSLAAATSTINTSDLREKTVLHKLGSDAPLMRVAARLAKETIAYQWNEAIEKKGHDARIHFGIGAQTVEIAFREESLDPAAYAIWCKDYLYDSVYDEGIDKKTGEYYRIEREMPRLDEYGNHAYRLGVRMDLLHILIATYHEKRQRELEARIEALEGK